MTITPITIALDFDGVIVKDRWPDIGEPVPLAFDAIRELYCAGHTLTLHTARWGVGLEDAWDFIRRHHLPIRDVESWRIEQGREPSPKYGAKLYIEDRAVGAPLVLDERGKGMIDWTKVRQHCVARGILPPHSDAIQ